MGGGGVRAPRWRECLVRAGQYYFYEHALWALSGISGVTIVYDGDVDRIKL